MYDHVSDIKGVSLLAAFKPIIKLLKLKNNDEIGGLVGSTSPSTQSSLANYNNRLLTLLDRAIDYEIGGGWSYLILSYFWFLIFTDFTIFLVHRFEHHPFLYKRIHKTHHKWVIPTPFASYAFHPVDGFLQSVPYHIFIFIFPFHRSLYLASFLFVTVWTILIHDSELIVGHKLENYINSPTHHTLHHLYFNCNYGQFFTWPDKLFSTYREPNLHDQSVQNFAQDRSKEKRWEFWSSSISLPFLLLIFQQ